MGRTERPLDPADGPLQAFAVELRKLRNSASGERLTYQKLARRVNYSPNALSQAANGEKLPNLELTLAYVEGCGGDREEWIRRWREVSDALHSKQLFLNIHDSPYLGLEPFDVEDRRRFFGRERLVEELAEKVHQHRAVIVVGESGCGKTSLLRAGLMPALMKSASERGQQCELVVITPGDHPSALLGEVIGSLPSNSERPRLDVLVVDQLEQIFTRCPDENERLDFLSTLLDDHSATRIVIAVRADFFGPCLAIPLLQPVMATAQLTVPPMTPEELTRVIERPAKLMGLSLEPGLVSTVLTDAPQGAAALPLVSHAMLETWRRREGDHLTLDGYHRAGGARGAIAHSADKLLGALSAVEREVVHQVFLRLAEPGEGTDDVSKPVARAELEEIPSAKEVGRMLELLAESRLIRLNRESVEVVHEALLREWPTLRSWLDEDREGRRIYQRLERSAAEWEALGRETGVLLRGSRLAVATDWAGRSDNRLNDQQKSFLDASVQQERDDLQSARLRNRRLKALATALAVLATVALSVTVFAVSQWSRAEGQQRLAVSRQLAVVSDSLADEAPATALLLSAQAYGSAPTTEAASSLLSQVQRRAPVASILNHLDAVESVAYSRDGSLVASGTNDGTIVVWEAATRRRRAVLDHLTGAVRAVSFLNDDLVAAYADGSVAHWDLEGHSRIKEIPGEGGTVGTLAVSSDGRRIAVGTASGIRLFDGQGESVGTLGDGYPVANLALDAKSGKLAASMGNGSVVVYGPDGAPMLTLEPVTPHTDVALSPDGNLLAAGTVEGLVKVWDVASGAEVSSVKGHSKPVTDVEFSPSGDTIASASLDQTVVLANPRTGDTLGVLEGHTAGVNAIAFDPEGRRIASGSVDASLITWDLADLPRIAATTVLAVAWSPDGKLVATGGNGPNIQLWRTDGSANLHPEAVLDGHRDQVRALRFSPDGRTLASGGNDRNVILWDVTSRTATRKLEGHVDAVRALSFSPDGETLASGSLDKTVALWETSTGQRTTVFEGNGADLVFSLSFSPDGRKLASAGFDKRIRMWDIAGKKQVATLMGHADTVVSLAFSPDGTRLVSGSLDDTVRIWDSRTGRSLRVLRGHAGDVNAIAMSSSGRQFASGGSDNSIVLWDLEGSRIATLGGHTDLVRALAFSPTDELRLASGGYDKTLRLWELGPALALNSACWAVGRQLTDMEWQHVQTGKAPASTCTPLLPGAREYEGGRLVDPDNLPRGLVMEPADGADPRRAGCAADAESLDLQNVKSEAGETVGMLELRYSKRCLVAWGRFVPNPAVVPAGMVELTATRPVDGGSAGWWAAHSDALTFGGMLSTRRGCVQTSVRIEGGPSSTARGTTECLQRPER